jgi:hypothetical protein
MGNPGMSDAVQYDVHISTTKGNFKYDQKCFLILKNLKLKIQKDLFSVSIFVKIFLMNKIIIFNYTLYENRNEIFHFIKIHFPYLGLGPY